jgi:TolB-like protein/Tfp pilus assembly protein PilF
MNSEAVRLGAFELDVGRRELRRDGAAIKLGSRATDILCALASARGAVVAKHELMRQVWPGLVVEDNVVAVHVSALRKVLDAGDPGTSHIVTVPGRGYRLASFQTAGPEADRAGSGTAPAFGAAIGVLPFTNLSGDPDQDYLADGIVEDIITGLSRIKWLLVMARNATLAYRMKPVDVRQAGADLGVRYLLDGSVRRAGDRLRIATQLIDAGSGVNLWAERYDRTVGDVFAVQDEIAMSVVGTIEPNLRQAEIERVKRSRPDSIDAYDLVLRALPHMRTFMLDGAAAAMPLLEKALELEPDYALAHALIARCHHFRFSRGGLDESDRASAIRHARAAAVRGDDATTLAIAAIVLWFDDHDVATAFELFDRALAVSPSNVVALGTSAFVLAWMGETEKAIERARRALVLSPYDSLNPYLALAVAWFHAGNYEASRDAASRAVDAQPRSSVSHVLLATALSRLDRREEARAAGARARTLDPTFTMRRWAVTVGVVPEVFTPFAAAWRDAGMPDG